MNITTITKKLKQVLSEKKLNRLGKETGFTQRKRNITAFQLVMRPLLFIRIIRLFITLICLIC